MFVTINKILNMVAEIYFVYTITLLFVLNVFEYILLLHGGRHLLVASQKLNN